MEVLIISEGGKEFGLGHLARCIPIYDAFRDAHHNVQFYVNVDEFGSVFLDGKENKIENWHLDITNLLEFVKDFDLVIIDSLKITNDQFFRLTENCKTLAVVDDIGLRNYQNNEVIVNWLIGSEKEETPYANARFLSGAKYAPLRKEFCLLGDKKIKEEVSEVVITMGGTDVRQFTQPIIEEVLLQYPDITVSAFVASGFNNPSSFDIYSDNSRVNIYYNPSDKEMVEILRRADIAIASGGHSIYELASIGIPTVHVLVVENQRRAELWKETGFTHFVGWYNQPSPIMKMVRAIELLKPREIRAEMSLAGQNCIQDNGAKLLVEQLEKLS
jgi:UDP-2,4-diacetamido-2,4,6-trideoxy-beta-L-altropyranose hydrolase